MAVLALRSCFMRRCVCVRAESSPKPTKGVPPACPPPKISRSLSKKAADKERTETRVDIGLTFLRWLALHAAKRLELDLKLALLLLDT